jgi:hypothetical protein
MRLVRRSCESRCEKQEKTKEWLHNICRTIVWIWNIFPLKMIMGGVAFVLFHYAGAFREEK